MVLYIYWLRLFPSVDAVKWTWPQMTYKYLLLALKWGNIFCHSHGLQHLAHATIKYYRFQHLFLTSLMAW